MALVSVDIVVAWSCISYNYFYLLLDDLSFVYMLLHFSAVFQIGRWSEIKERPVHTDLSRLVKLLPEICLNSRAETTRRVYRNTFNKFYKWCVLYNISSLPASDFHVALYLINLCDLGKSSSTINEAFYAINWAHNLAGVYNPCTSDLVVTVKEGSLRTVGHNINKKEPITPDILKQIVNTYGNTSSNLKDLRLATMRLLCFAGFLRFSELANLNITFCSGYVKLFLEKSKTDVYREGKDVVISITNNLTYPVTMLSRYLAKANISEHSNEYIFRSLSYCRNTDSYRLRKQGKISYTTARKILLSALSNLGLEKAKFGLHSLRSGGATADAASHELNDRLFKKHGRWKSDKAKDGYVKEQISERMLVTQNIGIINDKCFLYIYNC